MNNEHLSDQTKEVMETLVAYGNNCCCCGMLIGAGVAAVGIIGSAVVSVIWDAYRDDVMAWLKHFKKK